MSSQFSNRQEIFDNLIGNELDQIQKILDKTTNGYNSIYEMSEASRNDVDNLVKKVLLLLKNVMIKELNLSNDVTVHFSFSSHTDQHHKTDKVTVFSSNKIKLMKSNGEEVELNDFWKDALPYVGDSLDQDYLKQIYAEAQKNFTV